MESFYSDYFCRNTTEHLKGGLALAVLFHHIYQRTQIIDHDSLFGFFMQSLGYYCVSLFFFISGYGLLMSINRGGYLQTYQRNRVLPIFVINALLVLIYVLEKCVFGIEVSFENVLMSLTYGGDVVENGWYLLCIIVFYEIFYVSARFSLKHICRYVLALTIAYMLAALFLKMSIWWYISSLAFPCGVIFGAYKRNVDKLIRKHFVVVLFTGFILLLSCFVLMYWLGKNDANVTKFQHYMVSVSTLFLSAIHGILACFFVVLLLVQGGKYVNKGGWAIDKLSTIYLEIYVMQGAAFLLLRNGIWHVNNDLTFVIMSVILTIALAFIIHPLFRTIILVIKGKNRSCKFIK